jgi:hypothetical protein
MISALEVLIGRCLGQAEEEALCKQQIRHAAADQSIASQEKEWKGGGKPGANRVSLTSNEIWGCLRIKAQAACRTCVGRMCRSRPGEPRRAVPARLLPRWPLYGPSQSANDYLTSRPHRSAARHILFVLDRLITRQYNVEFSLFGCVQKQAVLSPAPPHLIGNLYVACQQETAQWTRDILIKENVLQEASAGLGDERRKDFRAHPGALARSCRPFLQRSRRVPLLPGLCRPPLATALRRGDHPADPAWSQQQHNPSRNRLPCCYSTGF